MRRIHFFPFDYIVIGYCLLMTLLIVALGRPIEQYFGELIFYTSMAAIAALVVRFMGERPAGWRRFVRLLYPAFMLTFFYTETGGTMFLLYDRFFDYQLVELEQAILGLEPTLYIDRYWLSPWWNEIFSAAYFSYYLMIPVLLMVMYIKRHDDLIRRFLTTGLATFVASYLMFFLYPIEGPRYFLANQYLHPVEGPFFRRMVNFAIDNGAVHGGCMPSSHVAVAIVVLAYTFKLSRKWGWMLLPVVVGLAIGTVWGRFHYVTDVVVGAAIGIGAVLLVDRCYSRWTTSTFKVATCPQMGVEHVS